MKKRIISLLLCAVLLLGILPPGLAAPAEDAAETAELAATTEMKGQWKDGKFTVTFSAPDSVTATLIAAGYVNGQMTQVQTISNVKGGQTVTFDELEQTYLTRVFAVDNVTCAPLCEKEEVHDLASAPATYYKETVGLPTADPGVTAALSSALSSYVQVMLAIEELNQYMQQREDDSDPDTSRVCGVAAANAAASFPDVGGALPARPDLVDVSSLPVTVQDAIQRERPALICDEATVSKSEDLMNNALDACGQMAKANAVLEAAADQYAEAGLMQLREAETALMSGPSAEQLEWAESISQMYDSYTGGQHLAQLAKDLGCDARRAYSQLVMAQNILQGHYSSVEGDLNEFWEKTMIATKASAKVGLFVCATIVTAGGTAALVSASTTITVGQAAGIAIGAADATIEVTTAGAKIILGPNHQIARHIEDAFKPVSDVLMVCSLFMGGGDTLGEKLAFFGDLKMRKDELYDQFMPIVEEQFGKLKVDPVTGLMDFDHLSIQSEDGEVVKELAEELAVGPTGFDDSPEETKTYTIEEVLEDFVEDRPCDDEYLEELIDDLDLEDDVDLDELTEEFERELNDDIQKEFDSDERDPDATYYICDYDEDGNLIRETLYGGDSKPIWSRTYDGPTGRLKTESFYYDSPEGKRIAVVYTYYWEEEYQEELEGRRQLYGIAMYEVGTWKPYYGEEYHFNLDGKVISHRTSDYYEEYMNGELQHVIFFYDDGYSAEYTYYTSTSEPSKLYEHIQPVGHLSQVQVKQAQSINGVTKSVTIYKEVWALNSWQPDEDTRAYGYVYHQDVPFDGSTYVWEVVDTEPW